MKRHKIKDNRQLKQRCKSALKTDYLLNYAFKYNLITESCEHPLKFPISARHYSMSTVIIP